MGEGDETLIESGAVVSAYGGFENDICHPTNPLFGLILKQSAPQVRNSARLFTKTTRFDRAAGTPMYR